ncbi:MAG: hypothetical protein NT094_00535 [Candidatus Staskawiczbacteria bacterium]|nr:hypothetical protein [Candidatus Staskawiczbacteria bacterium]
MEIQKDNFIKEPLVPVEEKKKVPFAKIAKFSALAILLIVVFVFFGVPSAKYLLGSLINGVSINTPTNLNRYAYGENIGWIDFNPTGGAMQVGDDGLTGYAYGENIGWIQLSSDATPPYSGNHWGVNNSTTGCTAGYSCLSGYAYGENIGWINFDPQYNSTSYGVKINTTTGEFSGYAYGENIGWISFAGAGYGVVTDWRAANTGEGATCATDENCTFPLSCVNGLCADGSSGSTIVNGVCGSASGASSTSAPANNLCSAGTATTVAGNGPWTWSCEGTNGGTTDSSCRATAFSGGGMPNQPQVATPITQQQKLTTLNYIRAQLEKIKAYLLNFKSPATIAPPTTPPTNLQPTTPPTTEIPAVIPSNNEQKINILQKLLNVLKALMGLISK